MTETTERGEDDPCPPPPTLASAHVRDMRIVNRKGLHARAAAKFVQCVDRFDAQVQVTRCGDTVGGDSIMGILMLGAGVDSTITVAAQGAQALDALEALEALVADRFGEDE
jgi:phosphocarrier protein